MCFVVDRNSEQGFFELRNSTTGQKEEHIRIGYTWIGTKKKWNNSMAKRIFTTIARAMGQQDGSEAHSLKLNWLT